MKNVFESKQTHQIHQAGTLNYSSWRFICYRKWQKTVKSHRKVLLHLDSHAGSNPYEIFEGKVPIDQYVTI